MFLLFEEFDYPTDRLRQLGLDSFFKERTVGIARCNYVGYHHNFATDTSLFVLPKVFQRDGKFLARYDVNALAHQPAAELLSQSELRIVQYLAEQIYFALRQYQRERPASEIVERAEEHAIKSNRGPTQTTAFESMLALIAFNRRHPQLAVQVRQIRHSKSTNQINWSRTFQQSLPIFLNGQPVYLETVGRQRRPASSDPLLTIYYSLLAEFQASDPTVQIPTSIETYTPQQFHRLKPKVPSFLRRSRSFYYSDSFRELHSLLSTYFDAQRAALGANPVEYLFTDDFQVIFERMVDALLSDESLLERYKTLRDGKQLDHLFGAQDIFAGNKIIYIGDSKYYKDERDIRSQRYKQFTYARNVIQENIYEINQGGMTLYSRNYRDPVSEGYNVTPNFFVFGTVQPKIYSRSPLLTPDSMQPERTIHFPNRLFDRDTLHVLYFRADFPQLLDYYVGRRLFDARSQRASQDSVRQIIRTQVIEYFNTRYDFYFGDFPPDFIETHFKLLNGKLFSSPALQPKHVLALEKHRAFAEENKSLLTLLAKTGICLEKRELVDITAL